MINYNKLTFMKKAIFSMLLMGLVVFSYAQKKPNINKAKAAFDKGDFVTAKTIIDQAITHEKTKGKPKTWYYRGIIYAALDTASNEPEAMKTSIEAFNQTLALDPNQKSVSEFSTTAGVQNVDSRLNGYYTHYFNKAIENYNEKDFKMAATNFENAYYINPKDTNAVLNAAYAASAIPEKKRAEKNFEKAIKAGVKDKNAYLQLYNYAVQKEDYNKALKIIRQGKTVHPNDGDLAKYEINLLIQTKQADAAVKKLEGAIKKDPSNPDYFFQMGALQEELKQPDNAKKSYMQAIDLDGNHYNSNYNLGALIFNQVSVIMKEKGQLGLNERAKSVELQKKADVKLKEALPYWEKVNMLKENDRPTLETLEYIYGALKMGDMKGKITNKLNNMPK